jgi:hypothetical protein
LGAGDDLGWGEKNWEREETSLLMGLDFMGNFVFLAPVNQET